MFTIPTVSAKLRFAACATSLIAVLAIGVLPLAAQEQPAAEAAAAEAPTAETPSAELPATEQPAPDPANENDLIAQELLANSPFMSKAFKERIAKSDTNRTRDLVFRGFAGDGGKWLICVYNNQSKQAEWVELGAQVNGITITEFDREGLRIKVVKDATSTYLNLEQPK